MVKGHPDPAQRVLASQGEISGQLADMRTRQASHISPYRQIMYAIESDIIDVLEQISYLTHRIVRFIQPSP